MRCAATRFADVRRPVSIDLLLLMRAIEKKKQRKESPTHAGATHTGAHAHAHAHTHLLISKLMVSLGSHPKATGVWENRFLEKGFIIRTFAH